METQPLVIEKNYNAPIKKVWSAITDLYQLRQWCFEFADFKPVVGFETEFEKIKDGRVLLHKFKVTEVVPESKLTYSWRYDGYAGDSFVTFELFEEGNSTRLVLTHAGLETFSQDVQHFARKNYLAGWTEVLDNRLSAVLENAMQTH